MSLIYRITKPLFQITMLLLVTLTLSSCGGSSSDDENNQQILHEKQNPNGIYRSGYATLSLGEGYDDAIAIVDGNRIIVLSVGGHFLIDGTFTSITPGSSLADESSDFIATADVYKDGVLRNNNIEIHGHILNQSYIGGTLVGAGGSFLLDFDLLYNRVSNIQRVDTNTHLSTWNGKVIMSSSIIDIRTDDFTSVLGEYSFHTNRDTARLRCLHQGVITPTGENNVYTVTAQVSVVDFCDSYDATYNGGEPTGLISDSYTGFVSIIDKVTADDTMIYAVTNGSHAIYGVLQKTYK